MPRKPKFKPVITRVKLNPEQAVLACTCSGGKLGYWQGNRRGSNPSPATYCDTEISRAPTTEQSTADCVSTGDNYPSVVSGAISS